MIKGNKVDLVPATLDYRKKVYEWCFQSETTSSHAGPPKYPEAPIATFEEFCDDYTEYYFTASRPGDGMGFIILHEREPVGFISYSSFHLQQYKSELDIWMNSEANCGKGFGVDAIVSLGEYLNKTLVIQELIMRPSIKNVRAIKAYKKAGFKKSDQCPNEYLLDKYVSIYGDGDYGADESVLLIKTFDSVSIF